MNLPPEYNPNLYQLLVEAQSIKFNEPQKALDISNFVYVQALKSSDEKLEAHSLYVMGVCSELLAKYPQAMNFLSESIKLANQLSEIKLMGDALNCVGVINDNLNNYANALKAYFKALKLYEESGENKKIAIVLSNIGLIYTNIKDFKNALKFYSQALDIAEEENDNESLLVTNINIGLTHNQLGNFEESLKFLYDALKLANSRNDKRRISLALDHIAETYILVNNYSEAYKLFEQSKTIKLELGDRKGLVTIYGTIGKIQLFENNTDTAVINLNKALDLATELGMKKSVFELHNMLAEAYEKKNNPEKSLLHLKEAYLREVDLLKEEAELKAKNISTQLEIEKAQQEAEIQKLKNIELAKALEDVKKLNVELKNVNIEKNEFMAIAVHDLKNPLQNILSTARVLNRSSGLNDSEKEEFTKNIISQTDRMFKLIKKLLDHNAIEQGELKIKPALFAANILGGELEENFKEEARKKDINLNIKLPESPVIITTDKDILYEILQNLVSNALKFSQPGKNVFFKIIPGKNMVSFEVKDEGPGFSEQDKLMMFRKFSRLSAKPTGGEHSTGLGLSIVKKLCELIGADISVISEYGNGAEFIIILKNTG